MSVTAVDGWCDIYDSVVATNRESRVIWRQPPGTVVAHWRQSHNIRMWSLL